MRKSRRALLILTHLPMPNEAVVYCVKPNRKEQEACLQGQNWCSCKSSLHTNIRPSAKPWNPSHNLSLSHTQHTEQTLKRNLEDNTNVLRLAVSFAKSLVVLELVLGLRTHVRSKSNPCRLQTTSLVVEKGRSREDFCKDYDQSKEHQNGRLLQK